MTGSVFNFVKLLTHLTTIVLFTAVQARNVEKWNRYDAKAHPRSPIVNQSVPDEVKNYFRKSAEPGDVMVFYVDPRIGGPVNETFNVVPMNPSAAEFWKTNVSDAAYEALKADVEHRHLSLIVFFLYDNENTTRPHGFVFGLAAMEKQTSLDNIYQISGYLPNPPVAMGGANDKLVISIRNQSDVEFYGNYLIGTVRGNRSEDFKRVEFAVFRIENVNGVTIKHCGNGDVSAARFQKLTRRDDDVPGLLLSKRLGGCSDHLYNAVPMSPRAALDYKSKLEDPILEFLNSSEQDTPEHRRHWSQVPRSSFVVVEMQVVYPDKLATRPAGFLFRPIYGVNVIVDNLYIPN